MDMVGAAKATLDLARRAGMADMESDTPECDYPHLEEMVHKMETTDMSEGKTGRWLGWIQCAVVVTMLDHPDEDGVTIGLEHMKTINKDHA